MSGVGLQDFAASLRDARIFPDGIPRAALRLPWAIIVLSLREANRASLNAIRDCESESSE
jgi:hypothetical protein